MLVYHADDQPLIEVAESEIRIKHVPRSIVWFWALWTKRRSINVIRRDLGLAIPGRPDNGRATGMASARNYGAGVRKHAFFWAAGATGGPVSPHSPRPPIPFSNSVGIKISEISDFRILRIHASARIALLAIIGFSAGCARTDIYYPYAGFDGKGGPVGGGRAVVLNGSDALGNTVIDVTSGGVRLAVAGGIDNSTSTREGYRTLRHGIAAAAWAAGAVGVANVAANAFGANQAANATSNVAASRAGAATAASRNATTVRLAEIAAAERAAAAAAARAIPAAGSVIPSTIPSTVVPIAP